MATITDIEGYEASPIENINMIKDLVPSWASDVLHMYEESLERQLGDLVGTKAAYKLYELVTTRDGKLYEIDDVQRQVTIAIEGGLNLPMTESENTFNPATDSYGASINVIGTLIPSAASKFATEAIHNMLADILEKRGSTINELYNATKIIHESNFRSLRLNAKILDEAFRTGQKPEEDLHPFDPHAFDNSEIALKYVSEKAHITSHQCK